MLLKDGVDRALYRRKARRRIFACGHGHARLEQNRALRIDEAGSNLGAADIYAESKVVSLTFGCLLLCAHLMFI
jgi:hypothetical protein